MSIIENRLMLNADTLKVSTFWSTSLCKRKMVHSTQHQCAKSPRIESQHLNKYSSLTCIPMKSNINQLGYYNYGFAEESCCHLGVTDFGIDNH